MFRVLRRFLRPCWTRDAKKAVLFTTLCLDFWVTTISPKGGSRGGPVRKKKKPAVRPGAKRAQNGELQGAGFVFCDPHSRDMPQTLNHVWQTREQRKTFQAQFHNTVTAFFFPSFFSLRYMPRRDPHPNDGECGERGSGVDEAAPRFQPTARGGGRSKTALQAA